MGGLQTSENNRPLKTLHLRRRATVVQRHNRIGTTVTLMENEEEKKGKYESYVVVHNIAKRHNVGTLARSATAFGVAELILVGKRDFNAFGSHGSTSHLRFRHFHSLSLARSFLKVTAQASAFRFLFYSSKLQFFFFNYEASVQLNL